MSAHNLEDVKVGDAVAITEGGWGVRVPKKLTVTKVTKTQVVLSDDSRWLKRGRKVGRTSWSRGLAKPWDEAEFVERSNELDAERRKNKVCAFFSDRRCNALTPEEWIQVEAVCDAVNARALHAKQEVSPAIDGAISSRPDEQSMTKGVQE